MTNRRPKKLINNTHKILELLYSLDFKNIDVHYDITTKLEVIIYINDPTVKEKFNWSILEPLAVITTKYNISFSVILSPIGTLAIKIMI